MSDLQMWTLILALTFGNFYASDVSTADIPAVLVMIVAAAHIAHLTWGLP